MTTQESGPRVLVVQHQADCGPAWFGTWLAEAGCDLDVVEPWRGRALPDEVTAYDGVLVLGGSMGAHDDAEVVWLAPLKELLRQVAAAGVPTLGICLGHQLLAVALGGRVTVNPRGQRVGLTTVGWTPEAAADPLVGGLVPPRGGSRRGVHWNGDVVAAEPDGTVTLARTDDGDLQVARFAPTVWGVQLHPEADRRVIEPWAAGDAERHAREGRDQAPLLAQVLADVEAAEPELASAWRPLAEAFARLCADATRTVEPGTVRPSTVA